LRNAPIIVPFRPQDRFNIFDLAVVVASLVESFISAGTGFLSALRVVRVFRRATAISSAVAL
jgi:hypothetical protein